MTMVARPWQGGDTHIENSLCLWKQCFQACCNSSSPQNTVWIDCCPANLCQCRVSGIAPNSATTI